jgi:hypothetical protein
MQVQHIDVYAGENRTQTLYARDSSNLPVDLTGLTISWSCARPPNNPTNLQAIFTYAGAVVSASAGSYSIPIAPGDTSGLTPGDYFHQAQTTDGSGNVAIVTVGRFRIRPLIGSLAA